MLTRKNQLLTDFRTLLRQGAQGILNEASRATLEHEFDTSDSYEAILKILDEGEIRENIVR